MSMTLSSMTTYYLNDTQMALQQHDKFTTIKNLEDDSANFAIIMSHWSCTNLYMASNNKEANQRLILIVMAPGRQCKFHAPLPPSSAHKLSAPDRNARTLCPTKCKFDQTLIQVCLDIIV